MANVTLVESINTGGANKHLDITRADSQHDGNCYLDHLVEKNKRYFLCVENQLKYQNLLKDFGKVTLARLHNPGEVKEVELDIVRNHPLQYAGSVFSTERGSEYGISEDYRFMSLSRKSSVEGRKIEAIAGMPDEDSMHSEVAWCFDTLDCKRLNFLLESYGRTIGPGTFMAMLFKEGDNEDDKNRIGFKSSVIKPNGIRTATSKELERYA